MIYSVRTSGRKSCPDKLRYILHLSGRPHSFPYAKVTNDPRESKASDKLPSQAANFFDSTRKTQNSLPDWKNREVSWTSCGWHTVCHTNVYLSKEEDCSLLWFKPTWTMGRYIVKIEKVYTVLVGLHHFHTKNSNTTLQRHIIHSKTCMRRLSNCQKLKFSIIIVLTISKVSRSMFTAKIPSVIITVAWKISEKQHRQQDDVKYELLLLILHLMDF